MRIAIAFLLCVLSACSEQERQSASPNTLQKGSAGLQPSAVPTAIPREMTKLEKQEANEIAKSESRAERKGKTLSLHPLSGKVVELTNIESCENFDSCVFYTYRGQIADGQFFLVNADYYEGGSVFVISRKTGEQIDTIDDPHVSPEGRYIVSASAYEAGRDSGVFLWEIVDGALVARFRYIPEDYQLFTFNRWIDSNSVELVKTAWPPKGECPEGKLAEFSMRLVDKNGKWLLEAASEKGKCFQ